MENNTFQKTVFALYEITWDVRKQKMRNRIKRQQMGKSAVQKYKTSNRRYIKLGGETNNAGEKFTSTLESPA